MSEREVTEEQVRQEHQTAVNVPAHWAYLVAVLVGGTLLMLGFVAWLGAA
jgi:hypothetical protein